MTQNLRSSLVHQGTSYSWQEPKLHAGSGSAGEDVIVLVHGLGLNRHMWQWQIPALSDKYRILSYDLIGHGDSLNPKGSLDLTSFSEQLYQLLRHESVNRACIVGFSLGGMIARRFAMDHTEVCSSLVIMNSSHSRTIDAQKAIDKRVMLVKQEGPASTVEAALERWFTMSFRVNMPQVLDLVRQWVLANDPAVYPLCYQVLASGVDELIKPNPPIICPTLIITGDQDSGSPAEMATAIASEIIGSHVKILKGLRHMALVEAPGQVNSAILDFLETVNHE